MDEFDPLSPFSLERGASFKPPPQEPFITETSVRYRRLDDHHHMFCVAIEGANMILDDNDLCGPPDLTVDIRSKLVTAAHTVRVSLRHYNSHICSLDEDERAQVVPAMLRVGGKSLDHYETDLDHCLNSLRIKLDRLIHVQKQNVASCSQIQLPENLSRGLELLCSNNNVLDSSGLRSRSEAGSGLAWTLYSKQQYPKFDGTFDNWLTWSSLMRKSVLPKFASSPELAVLMLKDAVGVSATCKSLIQSVDSTHENPAEKIMALLEGHFGSKSSLGLHYARELKQLKPISEGDYSAFNAFILSVENIVGKIVKNGVENYVDPGEVFRLQSCLPPSRREGWTDIYGNLSEDDRARPIGKFLEYCKRIHPAIQRMSMDRGLSNLTKSTAKVNFVESDHVKTGAHYTHGGFESSDCSSSFYCAFHESDTHATEKCKRFLDLVPKERSKFCTQYNICKVCLQSDHVSKDCASKTICSHCQKSNHHTLLCFLKDVNASGSPRNPREMLGSRDSKRKSQHPKQQSAINPGNTRAYASETGGFNPFSGPPSNVPTQQPFPYYPYGPSNVRAYASEAGGINPFSGPPSNVSTQQPFMYYPPSMYPPSFVNPYALNESHPLVPSNGGLQNVSSTGNCDLGGQSGQDSTMGSNPRSTAHKIETKSNPQPFMKPSPSAENMCVYNQFMRSNPSAGQSNTGSVPSTDVYRVSTPGFQPKMGNSPADSKFVAHSPSDVHRYKSGAATSNVSASLVDYNSESKPYVNATQMRSDSSGIAAPLGSDPSGNLGQTLASDGPMVTDRPVPPVDHDSQVISDSSPGEVISFSSQVHQMGLYAIYSIPFVRPGDSARNGSLSRIHPNDEMALLKSKSAHPSCFNPETHIVGFLDSGSDSTFITRRCARRVGARLIASKDLSLTTLDGTGTQRTEIVSFSVLDVHGRMHEITAYTRDFIGPPPCQIDLDTLEAIFPGYDCGVLQRPAGEIDMLLGADYFGLFPKTEIICSGNLSVMAGSLGPTLQGIHPCLTAYMVRSPTGHCIRSTTLTANVSMLHVEDFSMLPVEDISRKGPNKSAYSNCVMYEDSSDSDPSMPVLTYDSHSDFLEDLHSSEQCVSSSMDSALIDQTSDVPLLVDDSSIAHAAYRPPTQRTLGCEAFVISCYERSDISSTSVCQESYVIPCTLSESLYTTRESPVSTTVAKASVTQDGDDFSLSIARIASFIDGEDLATRVSPECGGCKCGNCPIPGHSYSFREEQELRLIRDGLRYIPERCIWVTSYPWIVDPAKLPNNFTQALAVLRSTERVLSCDPTWKETYSAQIHEHEQRGVCRKLSPDEIDSWSGPVFYIAHMALEQPKSESTPVRVVFNASQCYKGVSLNSCLAKGPDRYNTSLLGMLIRWREFLICIIGDIRKMYNSVHLEPLEQHVHRFLWRDCEDRPPDTYVMTRVSLGDKPSGTIAIVAKNETAKRFAHIDPAAAETLTTQAYVDDVMDSLMTWLEARLRVDKCNQIAGMGSFVFKGWSFGGEGVPVEFLKDVLQRVLGVMYAAKLDAISFPPKLNFSPKRRKVPTGPDLTIEEIPHGIPTDSLSRRICLSQVMSIYDPLGFLSPVTLTAKQLLRESWQDAKLWDDVLSPSLQCSWTDFFCSLFEVGEFSYRRSLTPSNADGPPVLVICSDGSMDAYGACAYVRYLTTSGSYHSTLLVAKSRICPKIRRTIPQMELNGAVLASRLKYQIMTESRLQFSEVYMLTDSEIVLHQIKSIASTFDVYTGVRIGEIQADNAKFKSTWAWIPGTENPADLATRPQPPENISPSSVWFNGPSFFKLPVSDWPMKTDPHREHSSDDVRSPPPHGCYYTVHGLKVAPNALFSQVCEQFSSYDRLINALARVKQALKKKSFKGASHLTTRSRRAAEHWCILQAQSCWKSVKEVDSQFRSVKCIEKDGIFVVQARNHLSGPLPIILPPKHRFTSLALFKAHEDCFHAGRAKTSARFRMRFHTSHLNRVVASVCKSCMSCRRVKKVLLKQQMCNLPPERLLPAPPFNTVVLDLFGPFSVRGEVNPRTTLKVWGVIFVCLTSRAVHIELASGYDTASFMLAFTRFACIRGYPEQVFADPGTQIQGAASEFQSMNSSLDLEKLGSLNAKNGTSWFSGPADSPWYQGAAESLIKSTKLSLKFSTGKSRLSPFELLTALYEIANVLNERPLGYFTPVSDDLQVITPNSLLLGRTLCANPGEFQQSSSLLDRVVMVKDTVDLFWKHWSDNYAPTLIQQSKWLHESRDLAVNDVVLIADRNVMKSEYKLGVISDVKPSRDGRIRRAEVTYKRYRVGESLYECRGAKDVKVTRSAQRLALLIPVDERKDI